MNQESYQALLDLIEIFHSCRDGEGTEIWCFKFIKKIVDGEILKENVSEKTKILAKKQFDVCIEWLRSIYVKVDCEEELRGIID